VGFGPTISASVNTPPPISRDLPGENEERVAPLNTAESRLAPPNVRVNRNAPRFARGRRPRLPMRDQQILLLVGSLSHRHACIPVIQDVKTTGVSAHNS
jgi:hypothetical protein